MSGLTEFLPGDDVRVIDGTFVGMKGLVLSREEARSLWEKVGGERPPLIVIPEMVFVLLPLFGRPVPVCLMNSQLEAEGGLFLSGMPL